ncbi:TlpA family protein disulfide reductase [candidate division KSB1 bacterium]|nr:TlpA family protein disulfide reductase [candidate division KSB1 bacterium]
MKRSLAFLIMLVITTMGLAQEEKETSNRAPDFTLPDLNGKNYQLYENLGEGPIVMNFWATWCMPCIEELKKIKKIYKNHSEKGVKFLAISVDDPKTVGRVKSFVRSHRYPFIILLDTNNEVLKLFRGTLLPYTVLLDRDGQIVYTHMGYRVGDEKELEEKIKKLLN